MKYLFLLFICLNSYSEDLVDKNNLKKEPILIKDKLELNNISLNNSFDLGSNIEYYSSYNGTISIYSVETNFKPKYLIGSNITSYGIGGVHLKYIDYDLNPTLNYGMDYGVGTEYKIIKNMNITIEIKNIDLFNLQENYDKKIADFTLKYIF